MTSERPSPTRPPKPPQSFRFRPIGVVHSCFPEKFGIPRQAGLVPEASARLQLLPPYDREEALRGLEGCSHLWVLFVFHASLGRDWRPTVRPPRLGGNRRLGAFATRSPFRPNPIGLSAVAFRGVTREKSGVFLEISGVDLLAGTPVLDIKPYLPYADLIPDARTAHAIPASEQGPEVSFAAPAQACLERMPPAKAERLRRLITDLLRQDPRPGYLEGTPARTDFGMRIDEWNVRWSHRDGGAILVTDIQAPEKEYAAVNMYGSDG